MSTLEIVVLFVFHEQQVAAQCSVSSAVLSQRHCVMDSRLTYHLLELMLLMILLMLIFPLLLISRINHNSIHYRPLQNAFLFYVNHTSISLLIFTSSAFESLEQPPW